VIGPQHNIPFQFAAPSMQGTLEVVQPGRIVSMSPLVRLQNLEIFWTAAAAGEQQKFNTNAMRADMVQFCKSQVSTPKVNKLCQCLVESRSSTDR